MSKILYADNQHFTFKGNTYKVFTEKVFRLVLLATDTSGAYVSVEIERYGDYAFKHFFLLGGVLRPAGVVAAVNLSYLALDKIAVGSGNARPRILNTAGTDQAYSDIFQMQYFELSQLNTAYNIDWRGDSVKHIAPNEKLFWNYYGSGSVQMDFFCEMIIADKVE